MFIFHSPDDLVVKIGSIDGFSALLAGGSLAGSSAGSLYVAKQAGSLKGYLYIAKQMGNKIIYERFIPSIFTGKAIIVVTNAGLIIYPAYKAIQTLCASWDNHRYKDIIPVNKYDEEKNEYIIQGPKIHIETSIDGKYIGHSSTELLQHFSKCCNFINDNYPLYAACSGSFNFNMSFEEKIENNKIEKIYKGMQCYLKKYQEYFNSKGEKQIQLGFDRDDERTIKREIYYKLEVDRLVKQKKQKNKEGGIKKDIKAPSYEDDCFEDEQNTSNKQESLTPKLKSSCSLL